MYSYISHSATFAYWIINLVRRGKCDYILVLREILNSFSFNYIFTGMRPRRRHFPTVESKFDDLPVPVCILKLCATLGCNSKLNA